MHESIIKEVLSSIIDKSTGNPVTDFIKKIVVKDGTVSFCLEYHNLNSQGEINNKYALIEKCKNLLKSSFDLKDVKIALNILKSQDDINGKKSFPWIKNIISIASGKGGVGKSTVSANLAVFLAKEGFRVGLLDADIYGPSIPKLFDLNEKPDVVENKFIPLVKYGISLMSIGFLMDEDEAVVWRGPMLSKALHQIFALTNWPDLDFLLIDTPPGTGDVHLTLSKSYHMDGAIVVSTPQDLAVADAQKSISMFNKLGVPLLGVIENMSYFVDEQGNKINLFGVNGGENLARKNKIDFLGQLPILPEISSCSDSGRPITYDLDNKFVCDLFFKIFKNIEKCIRL